MGAPGEQVERLRVLELKALFLQQGHIPGQGGRVAGDVDQPSGGEAGDGFDGIGVEALPGRIHHHHIGLDTLLFQLQGGGTGIGAEELGIFDAVALGVVLRILDGLGDDLHTDDLARGPAHGQSDGAHAAVEVQDGVLPGEPPATEPPVTEPPATEPVPTEPATTEPAPTEPAPTEPPKPQEPEFQMGSQCGDVKEVFYHEIAESMQFVAEVPSGKYVAYDFYRMFNMVLTIEGKYSYIVFNGEVYLPENGVLTFPLVYGNNDVSSPCSLYIGNFGYEDAAYTVKLSSIPGTQNCPETLPMGTFTVTTREGDDQGYYFRYIADKDGYLVVTFEDINIDKDCQISVYNHNSYVYSVDINTEVFVEVFEGDEVEVVIAVMDDSNTFPAAQVTITVVLEE